MEEYNKINELKSIFGQLNQHLDLKIQGNPFKQHKSPYKSPAE